MNMPAMCGPSGQKWLKVARGRGGNRQEMAPGRRTAGVRFFRSRKPARTKRGTASAWKAPGRRSSGASTREHGKRSRRTCSPATWSRWPSGAKWRGSSWAMRISPAAGTRCRFVPCPLFKEEKQRTAARTQKEPSPLVAGQRPEHHAALGPTVRRPEQAASSGPDGRARHHRAPQRHLRRHGSPIPAPVGQRQRAVRQLDRAIDGPRSKSCATTRPSSSGPSRTRSPSSTRATWAFPNAWNRRSRGPLGRSWPWIPRGR